MSGAAKDVRGEASAVNICEEVTLGAKEEKGGEGERCHLVEHLSE